MANYQNGKIYMIWAGDDRYYGSTIQQLCKRMAHHKSRSAYCSSSILFEKYGIENCKIELVELYPCNSREELCRKEGEYIRNNDCVNKGIAGRNKKEYYVDKKTLFKENYEKRKDNILKKNKCEVCDGSFTLANKKRHEATPKHQKHIQNATV